MNKTITIIGVGALGKTLAKALYQKGYSIYSLFNRTPGSAEKLGTKLDAVITGTFPYSEQELGQLIFITVSDAAIEPVADKLANIQTELSDRIIVHCSGNETAGILHSLKGRGAQTAAFHPLQTFNLDSRPDIFHDIYISLEGDEEAVHQLEEVVTSLEAHPLHLTPEAKSFLHASAVVASNYLVTLMQLAGDIAEMGGIDHHQARKALHTLVMTTVENSKAEALSDILSGPIARGDLSTVQKHLDLLESNQKIKTLYKQLGLETLKLAWEKEDYSTKDFEQLYHLLKNEIKEQ